MAKLSPDYIQFVLSLSTDQAQQEIHKLEKASSELKSENKELRKSMSDLTATGKRNSDEYRNLEEQYKKEQPGDSREHRQDGTPASDDRQTEQILQTALPRGQTPTTGTGQYRQVARTGTI